MGVKFEETYLSLLEKKLNSRGGEHPKVEIVKAGIPKYFPEVERILLEKYGLRYDPDLVLVGFLPNDVIDTHLGMESMVVDGSGYLKTREADELGPAGTCLYLHSHLFRVLLKRYVDRRIAEKYRPRWDDVYRENGSHEKEWSEIEGEYGEMASLSHEHGAEIVFIHIPQKGPWAERDSYPPRRLERLCASKGAGFIDVLPAMRSAGRGDSLYYEKDGHCRPAGQTVIADEVYDYLVTNNMVP